MNSELLVTIGAVMSIMAGALVVTPKGGRAIWHILVWLLSQRFVQRHEMDAHRRDKSAHKEQEYDGRE